VLFGVDVDKATLIERLSEIIVRAVPFNGALGLRLEDVEDGVALVRLPYRAELVGNPETGALHGGMITSLIDATCGVSVFARMQRPARIATLDLRIDYLRPATPPLDVLARAECYRVTRDVAFVRAVAHHGEPGDAIATAAGTFVVFDDGRSPVGRALAEQRRG
jgi:uncharacterized protein (TIGR00369 family)